MSNKNITTVGSSDWAAIGLEIRPTHYASAAVIDPPAELVMSTLQDFDEELDDLQDALALQQRFDSGELTAQPYGDYRSRRQRI